MLTTRTPLDRRDRDRDEPATLTIEVGAATATGATEVAAFDAALRELGVGEANVIRLSSVIPPRSQVRRAARVGKPIEWGDRLYCVYALGHATATGAATAAGIGWVQLTDGSGAGLFVEHHGESTGQVEELIHASLTEMTAARSGRFGPVRLATAQTRCTGRPACALVLAAYEAAGWERTS